MPKRNTKRLTKTIVGIAEEHAVSIKEGEGELPPLEQLVVLTVIVAREQGYAKKREFLDLMEQVWDQIKEG